MVILPLALFASAIGAGAQQKAPLACSLRLSASRLGPASMSTVGSGGGARPKASVPPGLPVQISGACVSDSKHSTVKIQITAPYTNQVTRLVARLSPIPNHPGGYDYQAAFVQDNQTGNYQVVLTAPDGVGKYEGVITVKPWKIYGNDLANTMGSLVSTASQLVDEAAQDLNNMPISPPQQQALSKLKNLQASLRQGPQHMQELQSALQEMGNEVSQNSQLEQASQPYAAELSQWQQDAEAEEQQAQTQSKATSQAAKVCGSIQIALETLKMMSSMLETLKTPLEYLSEWAKSTAKAEVASKLGLHGSGDLGKAAGLAKSWLGVEVANPGGVAALVADTLAYIGDATFNAYCQRFEGPLSADFRAQFNDPAWDYDLQISGRITLVYPKHATAGADLTGWVEGNATHMTLHENFISLQPRLRPNLLVRHVFPPPTLPYSATAGYKGLNPGYFLIPIHGQIIGDKLILNLQPAQRDFSDSFRAKVLYIFIEYTTFVPYVEWWNMPVQNAYFILTRSMGATNHWQIAMNGKTMILRREFTRSYNSPKGDFSLNWKTDVKACNPSCFSGGD
jgi:hypothetical protein